MDGMWKELVYGRNVEIVGLWTECGKSWFMDGMFGSFVNVLWRGCRKVVVFEMPSRNYRHVGSNGCFSDYFC